MTTLLQISDTHFGTERADVVEALLGLAAGQRPDVVVLSGDVTQRARRAQFGAARAFIERLPPAGLVAIPGNHDIPLFDVLARIRNPYGGYARAFGHELEPEFQNGTVLVVAVNTTRARRHTDGEVSPPQVERVCGRLRAASPAQLRIVVVHQPVLAIRASDETNLLHGRRHAVTAWAAAGADIVMGGHIHLPYVRPLRGAYEGLPKDVWTVQAGTAVSTRIREGLPNSVNVLRCDSDDGRRRCVVERWDYDESSTRFARHESHELDFDVNEAPHTDRP